MLNTKKIIRILVFINVLFFANAQSEKSNEKTLNHVLLIQWSQNHDLEVKKNVVNLFKNLPNKIEGLESFSMKEIVKSSENFNHILILRFTSEDALKIYDKHPDHEKIKLLAPKIISGFAEYDYWD